MPGPEQLAPHVLDGGLADPAVDEAAAHGAREPERGVAPEPDRQAALRALRSLEATEARLARNAKRDVDDARGKLVQDLLPVLDNLDRTIRAASTTRGDPAMLEGVRMVRQQLEGVLRGYGVERVEATGQRFDPALHEAIGVSPVSDPQRHGVVLHQLEPGYRFAERLLRPARVTVGKLIAPVEALPRTAWR
ncbi:MAG: nucleotide exchange factor GrpE [Kofleriaceae bacterium]